MARTHFNQFSLKVIFASVTLALVANCSSQTNLSNNQNGFGMIAQPQSIKSGTAQSGVALTALNLSQPSVVGGDSAQITLSVADPAPAGGMQVRVSSSDPAVLVPASVRIEAGESTVSFSVRTANVDGAVWATVSAEYENSVAGATLLVLPPATATFSVSVLPSTVTVQQGKSASATVTTRVNTGFDHSLQLKASGEPAGVSLSLKPQTIPAPGSGTSKLTVSVASSVQTGSYPITVTASGGTASASAKATVKVVSGNTNPNATFKGCWYRQGGHRYQGLDVSVGNPGTYTFNAVLYRGASCNPNDFADQFGFGQLIQFGGFGCTFWFTDFADQTDMSALWYVGDENSQCVNYSSAPDC